MAFNAGPMASAVARNPDTTARTTAELAIGMHLRLPRASEQHARILRVHGETRTAGVLVGEEHSIPMLAAIGRAVNPALLLRTGKPSQSANENDAWIVRIYDDVRDAP